METTKNNLQETVRATQDAIDKKRERWYVDAAGKTLGRLAVEIVKKMIGKHKPYYCDRWDCGDFVVVTNVEKVEVTGKKLLEKIYRTHSGYKGHLKETALHQLLDQHPERVIRLAVKGMLPKNKMRKPRLKRLKLFVGPDHAYDHFPLKQLPMPDEAVLEENPQ